MFSTGYYRSGPFMTAGQVCACESVTSINHTSYSLTLPKLNKTRNLKVLDSFSIKVKRKRTSQELYCNGSTLHTSIIIFKVLDKWMRLFSIFDVFMYFKIVGHASEKDLASFRSWRVKRWVTNWWNFVHIYHLFWDTFQSLIMQRCETKDVESCLVSGFPLSNVN